MPPLTEAQVLEVSASFQQEISKINETLGGVLADDIHAAATSGATWIDQAIPSFVNALPEPFRSHSTANQKLRLFMLLIVARFNLEL